MNSIIFVVHWTSTNTLLDKINTLHQISLPLENGDALTEMCELLKQYYQEQYPIIFMVLGGALQAFSSWKLLSSKKKAG